MDLAEGLQVVAADLAAVDRRVLGKIFGKAVVQNLFGLKIRVHTPLP